MLGDKIRQEIEYCRVYSQSEEDALEELDQLIEVKNEYNTLKARVGELEKDNSNLIDKCGELIADNILSQEYIEIGKALIYFNLNGDLKAFCGYHIFGENYMRIYKMMESYKLQIGEDDIG
jgi:predicted transcriptional regulator